MDFLRDFVVQPLLLAVGLIIGAVFHEGGHALFGALAGIRTRFVNIGIGRPLIRLELGRTWLILRICPLAAGWVMPDVEERRWARIVLVAGGPLGNLILLGLVYAATLAAPQAYDLLEPIGFVQVAVLILTLMPVRQTFQGVRVPTDGLRLIDLLFRPEPVDIAASYASLLRSVQPADAAAHPRSRHAVDILFQARRFDRWSETWARRDAALAVRSLLDAPDLTSVERAFLLSYLVALDLVFGDSDVSPGEREAWSAEAVSLAPEPWPMSLRGAVLSEACDAEGAHRLLVEALDGFVARRDLSRVDAALAHAFRGCAAAAEGLTASEAGLDELADTCRDVAARWFVLARKLMPKRMIAAGAAIERLETKALGRRRRADRARRSGAAGSPAPVLEHWPMR